MQRKGEVAVAYSHALAQVRERALRVINQCGYKAHPFPLRDLVTLLCFQVSVTSVDYGTMESSTVEGGVCYGH